MGKPNAAGEPQRPRWRFQRLVRFARLYQYTIEGVVGAALNSLGIPGFCRPGVYEARCCEAHIRVRCTSLYTTVSVNGLDVSFHRLTGKITGVGFIPSSGCRPDSTQGLSDSAVPPVPDRGPAQS